MLNITTDFKRRGIIKRLMVTPLQRYEWIVANILTQSLLAVVLTLIMFLVAKLAFNSSAFPEAYSWLLIFLGAVLFTGMGMFISGFIKDVEAASAIGNAIAFPMMFLSGSFWPIEMMPPYMQIVAKLLPLTYFSEGLRIAMVYGRIEISDFIIVFALALIFILLGSFMTRWEEE